MDDNWNSGIAYDRYMGRWSKRVASDFLSWLAIPPAHTWMDVGAGTGSLTKSILEGHQPKKVISVDPSTNFISHAKRSITEPTVNFVASVAQSLGLKSNAVDVTVSGLVLNFVPQPETALQEMKRATQSGGTIGVFIWDYAEGMQMIRYFWDAAVELREAAREHDEGIRFPICREGQLESLFQSVKLKRVDSTSIEIKTNFQDFDDYWGPFLENVGTAPAYTMSLDDKDRRQLEEKLHAVLPIAEDGSISMTARAWAVKAIV